jgi:hypothetical protein
MSIEQERWTFSFCAGFDMPVDQIPQPETDFQPRGDNLIDPNEAQELIY